MCLICPRAFGRSFFLLKVPPAPGLALSITVLVGSTEPYSGKSALVLGLAQWLQSQGIRFCYSKPLATSLERQQQHSEPLFDDDAHLIGEMLQLAPADLIPSLAPSASAGNLDLAHLGEAMERDYFPALQEKLESSTAQVTIMEGPSSLAEGCCLGLHLPALAARLDAPVLLIHSWQGSTSVETLVDGCHRLEGRASGLVLNAVEPELIPSLKHDLEPLLQRLHLPLLGVLPRSPLLRSVSVGDLSQRLAAEVLCCPERLDLLVETLSIGAMSVNSAMQFFRRRRNMAVITGADRTDIQLAALEASTQCLILTGASSPLQQLVNRAEELEVPVLKVSKDTLNTVALVERAFGNVRLHEPIKASFALRLMRENCDFTPLIARLNLPSP